MPLTMPAACRRSGHWPAPAPTAVCDWCAPVSDSFLPASRTPPLVPSIMALAATAVFALGRCSPWPAVFAPFASAFAFAPCFLRSVIFCVLGEHFLPRLRSLQRLRSLRRLRSHASVPSPTPGLNHLGSGTNVGKSCGPPQSCRGSACPLPLPLAMLMHVFRHWTIW